MTSKRVMTSEGGFVLEGLTKTAPHRYDVGGATTLEREQAIWLGDQASNGSGFSWTLDDSVGDLTVVVDEEEDDTILTFTEQGLWAVNLHVTVAADGGNITELDIAVENEGTDLSLGNDADFEIVPAGTWEGMLHYTWWFEIDSELRFTAGWALDGGTATANAGARMVRLA